MICLNIITVRYLLLSRCNPNSLLLKHHKLQLEADIRKKLKEKSDVLRTLQRLIKEDDEEASSTTSYTSAYEIEVPDFSPIHGTNVRKPSINNIWR